MSREPGTTRRQFTPDEKATILRRHLADKVSVSDLCDEYHIQPSLFYLWQRQALDNLGAAFQDGRTRRGLVDDYNHFRLHSAIGYITPADMLAGRAEGIWAERDRKLEAARARRRAQHHAAADHSPLAEVTEVH